ncbi:unnamed protein product [Eretmochelys imbricata]
MGLKPDSKAPATHSIRGGDCFLSSSARSLTDLSSLPRQGFEGLPGPPTCVAGGGGSACSGTGGGGMESSPGENDSIPRRVGMFKWTVHKVWQPLVWWP